MFEHVVQLGEPRGETGTLFIRHDGDDGGMASFRNYLTLDQAESIRAYVSSRAKVDS